MWRKSGDSDKGHNHLKIHRQIYGGCEIWTKGSGKGMQNDFITPQTPWTRRYNGLTLVSTKGAFINDVTHLGGGGEGVGIFVTLCDRRGEGVDASMTSHQGVHVF